VKEAFEEFGYRVKIENSKTESATGFKDKEHLLHVVEEQEQVIHELEGFIFRLEELTEERRKHQAKDDDYEDLGAIMNDPH